MRRIFASMVGFAVWAVVPPAVSCKSITRPQRSRHVASSFGTKATGLSLLHPYWPGKVPVIFVHGLWSTPWSWSRMVQVLETDPAINERFQFWTFGYSTATHLYSSYLLRSNLQSLRQEASTRRARITPSVRSWWSATAWAACSRR